MIAARHVRRGQPLLVLGALLVGWIGLRAALWAPPFETPASAQGISTDSLTAAPRSADGGPPGEAPQAAVPFLAKRGNDVRNGPGIHRPSRLSAPVPERGALAAAPSLTGIARPSPTPSARRPVAGSRSGARPESRGIPRTGKGVNHARPSAVARSSSRDLGLAASPGIPQAARGPARLAPPASASPRRWSGDAWLLLREGSAQGLAPGRPSYGRSQAGAVLRYRLAPSSAHRPQAYLRASSALEGPRDAEIAAGLAARPLGQVPVRLAAELRVSDTRAGTSLRPAVLAVTEFPPLDLPLGARGEAYVQGGYVGGQFDTPFIDGQLRVARRVAQVGRAGISAGIAAWGGAQKGASRLDIGPSAAVAFRLGEVNSRLTLDYRVRIAGDAQPASGPALTLSAGF